MQQVETVNRRMDYVAPKIFICGKQVVLGEISRMTGISMAHLSRIVNGKRTPSLRCANKIASYLGVSMDDLHADLEQRRQ